MQQLDVFDAVAAVPPAVDPPGVRKAIKSGPHRPISTGVHGDLQAEPVGFGRQRPKSLRGK